VDGSDAAALALGWAGRLAQRAGAELVVTTAFEPDQAEVSPALYEELKQAAQHRLDVDWSAPLRSSTVSHRSLLLAGSPDTLLQAADEENADLVVVGPRGHGTFARMHIGSVAHYLAHHTTRPLAIVPAPGALTTIDRIVVGVDSSESSDQAVRWCADLARIINSEVIAVYAIEPLVEWVRTSDPRSWRTAAEREMRDWVAPLVEAGVVIRTRVIQDIHPVAALVGVVEAEKAGLAVVGTRGIGGFLGLRLGHIPIQLVHHAQMPVVLVPPE